MIYLDSSAFLKLIVDEPETAALGMWLTDRSGIPVSSSELARVEVLRACRRRAPSALLTARQLLSSLDLIELSGVVEDMAAELEGSTLRSLSPWRVRCPSGKRSTPSSPTTCVSMTPHPPVG